MPVEEKKSEGFDRVYELVGGHGWFQWRLLLIISIQITVASWHHIGYTFIGHVPDHWCLIKELQGTNWTKEEIKRIAIPMRKDSSGSESEYEECTYYNLNYQHLVATSNSFEDAFKKTIHDGVDTLKCSEWDFDDKVLKSTVPSEFGLVCDRRILTATIQSSYMAGGMIGTILFGTISDRFLGRRKTLLLTTALYILCGFAAAFSKSYWMFLFLRVILSFGVFGATQNSLILLAENCDTKGRSVLGILEQVPFGVGICILPGLAYLIPKWDMLQLTFGVISLSLFSYIWILPDSPRWHAVQGNDEDAVEILLNIARVNKMPEPNKETLLAIVQSCHQKARTNNEVNNQGATVGHEPDKHWFRETIGNFKKLISTAEIRKRSICFWTMFMSVSMVYYGVVFTKFTSDLFLLAFLGGLMELPACVGIVPFVSKFGRRLSTVGTFLLTGILMIWIFWLDASRDTLRLILAMSAKLFISSAFAVLYLLGPELYPTEMRSTGLAVAIFCGRIGSIIAPYIVDLMQSVGKDVPTIIFGISATVAGFVALGLPETQLLEMTDQVYEVEMQGIQSKDEKRRMSIFDGITQF